MQLWQFWRPSAWADFFHGYTAKARILGPFTHLKQTGQLAVIGSIVSLSLDTLQWYVDGLFGFVAMIGLAAMFMTFAARANNTLVRGGQKCFNMPSLFSHLRQLSAASRIIQDHIHQSRLQPVDVSRPGTDPSGLVLMLAMKKHARVTKNLMMRLEASYITCIGQKKQVLLDKLNNKNVDEQVDTIEEMMGHSIYMPFYFRALLPS